MNPPIVQSRRRLLHPSDQASQVAQLSNGRYSVRLSNVGSGISQLNGVSVSRWNPDATQDSHGIFIYLRDLDDYAIWSAGLQPTRTTPQAYEFRPGPGGVEILRTDNEITCQLGVCVSSRHDFEVRRCLVMNGSDRPRRIELTSYLEWVLGSGEGDANHPAFSKLFVETQFCAARSAILACRRPRQIAESEFWGFHSIVSDTGDLKELEFETNRMRFVGRGRSMASPIALEPGAVLTGDFGSVLDPIASFRVRVSLEPGEAREIAFVTGAAPTRVAIDEMLATVESMAQIQSVVDSAIAADATKAPLSSKQIGNGDGDIREVRIHAANRPLSTVATKGSDRRRRAFRSQGSRSEVTSIPEPLKFENGLGGFTADGREYVIRLAPDGYGGHRLPPLPWVNVISNPQAGFLVTERGAGYTWSGNSRINRLTGWHNDPVLDPHAEAIWIRNEDTGSYWSPTPGPAPAPDEYRVRHGHGYTIFEHESHELSEEVTTFMTADDPVKLVRLRIANLSDRTQRLSIFSYLHWALGGLAAETANSVATEHDEALNALLARNPNREPYRDCVAFFAIVPDWEAVKGAPSFTCDRTFFLGRNGETDAPNAVVSCDELDGRAGSGIDPCGAWQLPVELPPGDAFSCTFMLGEAPSRDLAASLIHKYNEPRKVDAAYELVKQCWQELLGAVTIETPAPDIDLMVNGWLTYQNLSCRMWGRSAYYQPGGAFGFRDQLQDSAALIYVRPDLTRLQILRHAAQQFVEGDVLHWWHPDTGYGVRTRFSDDLLWLPLIVAEYVQKTGNRAVLDEQVTFIVAPPLAEGQQEAYLRPAVADETASLYEHCCRALDRGLTSGVHGLPLIGCGDWNDGFSRVGSQGKGESVWLGFFIEHILQQILPICSERGDTARLAQYSAYRQRLTEALNGAGWDGAWYRRAYYDNGQPIGSATSDECQIDALAQAWAVISGVAPADRAELAIQAVEDHLVRQDAGMIRLLSPPFSKTPNDPGYIKGYLPGIRENGGQYTHGVLWVVRAMAEMGRGTRAVELMRMLTPVWHTSTPERVGVYQTEPYAVVADIYSESPHEGRGGWSWYTGSAGWMFRIALESILGFAIEGGQTLVLNPSISSDWPSCKLKYRLPDGKTCYEITIENPSGQERGVRSGSVDGLPIAVEAGSARIPLARDSQTHRVVIQL